jgi:hypothetical protein
MDEHSSRGAAGRRPVSRHPVRRRDAGPLAAEPVVPGAAVADRRSRPARVGRPRRLHGVAPVHECPRRRTAAARVVVEPTEDPAPSPGCCSNFDVVLRDEPRAVIEPPVDPRGSDPPRARVPNWAANPRRWVAAEPHVSGATRAPASTYTLTARIVPDSAELPSLARHARRHLQGLVLPSTCPLGGPTQSELRGWRGGDIVPQ